MSAYTVRRRRADWPASARIGAIARRAAGRGRIAGWYGPYRGRLAAPRRLRGGRAGAAVRAAGPTPRWRWPPWTAVAAPPLWQAVVASFLLALVAGGPGAARGLAPWSRLASLMLTRPSVDRHGHARFGRHPRGGGARRWRAPRLRCICPRSGRPATRSRPAWAGRRCCCAGPARLRSERDHLGGRLHPRPGIRAFGAGTVVALTGLALGAVPAVFPTLAAMPTAAAPAVRSGCRSRCWPCRTWRQIFAGIITVRIAPVPVLEAALLWGFAAGTAADVALAGLGAAFAGGLLGNGRLSAVGPSGFQVGLEAILEIGVTGPREPRRHELAHPPPASPRLGAEASGERIPPASKASWRASPRPAQPAQSPPPGQHDETDDACWPPDLPEPMGRQKTRTTGSRAARLVGYLPFCRTLISPPTELVNWSWQACWAVPVFAPPMQL